MKKLEITIKPESLEKVKEILFEKGCTGMTVISAMGCGNQKGDQESTFFKGGNFRINLLPKIQVIAYVSDEIIEDVLISIHEQIASGQVGDGKVAVYAIEDLMRIRTSERGDKAL
ncbi:MULTISPECIES: P-II family nitrogen regulator [unclassified Enterococcus]|uniref:P-II family nitrogen regulator n=1 Tax=unclassified Enterococcus TaxID=2608891 RepID=UPI001555865E|nr:MULTISPECIES: P-II family nitrogen regulator [unclassified Enterococcus]MBS7576768.1 P-II family nitrogen regulator [Enterococcus sp. MMGLQ5-2]MBS7583745.1 P-II family nitrogen regulator [Enterococcus sp. MMGLQ5-1]NPD11606.1 P-II family nitrogen regulator [Enterococcus sp. MMGLQ5-1]NPD36605.1 P-II family nitrogen regulator [Enterococcus sp. MMGLQ5-2]